MDIVCSTEGGGGNFITSKSDVSGSVMLSQGFRVAFKGAVLKIILFKLVSILANDCPDQAALANPHQQFPIKPIIPPPRPHMPHQPDTHPNISHTATAMYPYPSTLPTPWKHDNSTTTRTIGLLNMRFKVAILWHSKNENVAVFIPISGKRPIWILASATSFSVTRAPCPPGGIADKQNDKQTKGNS